MKRIEKIWRDLLKHTKRNEPSFLTGRVDAYYHRTRDPQAGGHILEGSLPGDDAIRLVSNDYLSIAGHKKIRQARIDALQESENEMLRSGVYRFGEDSQARFEQQIAQWASAESALLSQSGWSANVGLVQSIAAPEVPVYVDMMAHMSLWEGIKSAGATPRPFRHNNVESLEKLVNKHGQGVILVDSLYSTSGTLCPLTEVVEIAERSGCMLVVDESHSLGVIGEKGEGMVADLGLADRVDFRTASLSKAFAGRGGIIIGSKRHIEYIKYESFPSIFSSGVHEYDIAGFSAALEVIQTENHRREKMRDNADFLRNRLDGMGYDVSASQSQIMSMVPGPENQTIVFRDALEARGVFGSVFCAPATPKNRSLIRFSINAGVSQEMLTRVADVCCEVRDIVGADQWLSTAKKDRKRPQAKFFVPEPSMAI
ncbi:MAG: alpha-hydroxyketone-type quorum-sensing autoinducer synthase [bacterium]